MKVFWWQGGVHIEPENDEDRVALLAITAVLPWNGIRVGNEVPTGPAGSVKLSDEKAVVGVD